MTSPEIGAARASSEQDGNNEMTKYGITRVSVDYFHYKGFRYTALEDAVAEAKRHAALQDRHERTRLR